MGLKAVTRCQFGWIARRKPPLLRYSMNTGNSDLFDKRMDINIKPFHLIALIALTFLFYMFQERRLPLIGTDG